MITNERPEITTAVYRTHPSAVAWRIVGAWTACHWWVVAVPLAIVAVASLYDWRWIVAGLFLLLVAVPGVLAFVYYYHALSPEAARATIPHQVTVGHDSLTIVYMPEDEQWHPDDLVVPFADILRVEDTGSALVAWLKGEGYRYVEMPRSAFVSDADFYDVIKILHENDLFGTKFAD